MQNCPDELLAILPRLLRAGLLRIRHAASEGDAALCMIEADHLHNVPELIEHFADELLDFYLNVERPTFLEQLERHAAAGTDNCDVRQLEPLWAALEKYARTRGGDTSRPRPQSAM